MLEINYFINFAFIFMQRNNGGLQQFCIENFERIFLPVLPYTKRKFEICNPKNEIWKPKTKI